MQKQLVKRSAKAGFEDSPQLQCRLLRKRILQGISMGADWKPEHEGALEAREPAFEELTDTERDLICGRTRM